MKRITVELVREAYKARGTKPCQSYWETSIRNDRCECPALVLARHFDSCEMLNESKLGYVTRILKVSYTYMDGFLAAIDIQSHIPFEASREFVQGYEDGLAVRKEFFNV